MTGLRVATAALLLVGPLCAAAGPAGAQSDKVVYDLVYGVRIVPTEGMAHVTLRVGAGGDALRAVRFRIDPERHRDFRGDGELEVAPDAVIWEPGGAGAMLSYRFRIDHLRDARSYDARCARNWALFRGDDLVPPARVRTRVGARSRSVLRLRLPAGWKAATPYPRMADGGYRVDHGHRRFDRPTGWFVAGKLGILRERIAGVRVAVAGPVGHGLRRHDLLALLRWTLPTLRRIVPDLPDRLLVVSAGDPMWRGGLSGSGSLYVHAERPLIARDGTSPILHELFHTTTSARSGEDGDWIVEGLAELYSLEMLVRSKTLSRKRYEKALRRLEQRGRGVRRLRQGEASGDVTARAVTLLRHLDALIRERSEGTRDLDHVVVLLGTDPGEITTESFHDVAEQATGVELDDFFERYAAR